MRRSSSSRRCARAGWRSAHGWGSSRPLSRRLGVGHVSAVSSGTAGLHLAIRAAGVEAGDDVVTTPFSFVASANCLLYENAKPIFCDIDPRTLNLDAEARRGDHGPHHRLLPVHIFGYPADMPAFEALAADGRCGSSKTPARRSARDTPTGPR